MLATTKRPIDDSPEIIRCTSCGSRDVRPSALESVWDGLMTSMQKSAFRCHCCRKRFYARVAQPGERLVPLATRISVEQGC